MTQERRLGRGLGALLGDGNLEQQFAEGAPAQAGDGLVLLNVYEIDSNPFQPRQNFDDAELDSLCESIKSHGLLQPIVVRHTGECYQVVAGERRLRAAIKAGYAQVPAQLRETDDQQMAELAIVENLQRKDLNPLEKAAAFQRYLQTYQCPQEELAGRLKVDRSTVANLIRLLELPEPVQQAVREGKLTQGHARALLPLGEESEQVAFSQRIQKDGLSVRATESLVQEAIKQADVEPLDVIQMDGSQLDEQQRIRQENLTLLETQFRHALGTPVDVKQSTSGRGRIVIHFASHEEFERLQSQLCDTPGQYKEAA